MNKKVLIPIITAVLLAFGINLDKFGIDLDALLNGNLQSASSGAKPTADLTLKDFDKSKSNAGGSTTIEGAKMSGYQSGAKWSKTNPAINLHHVFEGEINRKGRPVGFHSRPGGVDPATARLVRIRDKPNKAGVYTAMIEVRDGTRWLEKFSSFFPDHLSSAQVTQAVLNAYQKSKDKKRQPWRGPSGQGFEIEGYTLSKGDINTAYPIYK